MSQPMFGRIEERLCPAEERMQAVLKLRKHIDRMEEQLRNPVVLANVGHKLSYQLAIHRAKLRKLSK